MALKFRRGTTAQQSGSLAFGEPYVNTTLGTLLIGGPDGDITLSSTGTGSTGNFGAISGSGLDITGNANIHGNLTVGGELTIGDQTSDTINVVASISSSLIPATTDVFDIGSPDKIYKNVYGHTISGSRLLIQSSSNPQIRLVNETTGIEYHIQNGDGGNFQIHNGNTDDLLFLFSSGSLEEGNQNAFFYSSLSVSESINAHAVFANTIAAAGLTGSFSGSVYGIGNVISYSASVESKFNTISANNTSLNSFTASAESKFTEIGVVSGSLISSASAAKSTNDLQDISITNLNSATSSYETKGRGIVSGSSQVTLSSTTGYNVNEHINHTGVLINAGNGLTGGGSIAATRTLSIATGGVTNAMLANSTISGISLGSNLSTLTIGTGLSGTSYNGNGAVTIANTGVTSAVAGTGVGVSGATGAVTISIGQSVATTATPTFGNLTINGTITATGDITAYFTSDKRHKNNIQLIPNALEKVSKLNGVTWEWNDDVNEVTKSTPKTGLIAQEVQEVLPQVVVQRENGYLGLDYSKMMGLLVEAIKEQQIQIEELKAQIGSK